MINLSVIIPVYNNEKYIGITLNSVFDQEMVASEVIVIDDGSTDKTKEILQPYMSRIKYHYQENQGAQVARNKGLDVAKGEYIAFLDSDDIWATGNINLKMDILKNNKQLDGIFSDFMIFDKNSVTHARGMRSLYPIFSIKKMSLDSIFDNREERYAHNGTKYTLYFGNIFKPLFQGNFILTSTSIFRRESLSAAGKFNHTLITQQDYDYFLRIAKNTTLAFVDSPLVKYRRHSSQLTAHKHIERIVKTVIKIIGQYENEFHGNDKEAVYTKRMYDCNLTLAKIYIGSGKNREARKLLLNHIRKYPLQLNVYLHFILALVPHAVFNFVRGIFRKVRGS